MTWKQGRNWGVVILVVGSFAWWISAPTETFDVQAWKSREKRPAMVPDLKRRFLQPGRQRESVEQLLGRADLPNNRYWLKKNEYGFGDVALQIHYDSESRLVSADILPTE